MTKPFSPGLFFNQILLTRTMVDGSELVRWKPQKVHHVEAYSNYCIERGLIYETTEEVLPETIDYVFFDAAKSFLVIFLRLAHF